MDEKINKIPFGLRCFEIDGLSLNGDEVNVKICPFLEFDHEKDMKFCSFLDGMEIKEIKECQVNLEME